MGGGDQQEEGQRSLKLPSQRDTLPIGAIIFHANGFNPNNAGHCSLINYCVSRIDSLNKQRAGEYVPEVGRNAC